jgi:hypothetical protein
MLFDQETKNGVHIVFSSIIFYFMSQISIYLFSLFKHQYLLKLV